MECGGLRRRFQIRAAETARVHDATELESGA